MSALPLDRALSVLVSDRALSVLVLERALWVLVLERALLALRLDRALLANVWATASLAPMSEPGNSQCLSLNHHLQKSILCTYPRSLV